MKPKGFLKSVGLCFVLFTLFTSPTNALDSKYNRNGEVYVLIGDGSDSLKGIYRMNNAESGTIYASPIRYLDNNDVNNALGFTVDLNRHIYPFNETSSGWTQPEYIYRQVVDDVDYLQVDYGQHSYYHDDYRFCYAKRANGTNYEVAWCRGNNIYRSNTNRPSNNYIQKSSCSPTISYRIDNSNSSTAQKGAAKYSGNYIYSLGPGEFYGYSLPAGYKYVGTKVPIYSGKKWYKIKNNSWYSCWNTGDVMSRNYSTTYWNKHSSNGTSIGYFYWTVGEKESINTHVYSVEEYFSKNGDSFNQYNPQYHKLSTSNEVGRTSEVVVETFCRAGCLDGCGNANGGGTGSAERTISSVAFQPALTGSTTGNRRYFYARTNGQTDASIKLNGSNYSLSKVIGLPNNLNTEWIGISLAGVNSDYVYAIGTDVIKNWYKMATNSNLGNNHQITAVSVSNQWEEQGGIVFAYDDTAKLIYKFVRDEKAGGISEYEIISCSDLASKIGSVNTEVDDIQADGFGSLFFGLSYPSKNMSSYNPTTKFKTTDAIHYHQGGKVMEGAGYSGCMLFRQNFSKVVYKRDYLSGIISRINEIPYGYKFYHIPVTVPARLVSSLSSNPSNWLNIINTAYSTASSGEKSSLFFVANHAPRSYISSSDFTSGLGSCGCSTYKNQAGSSQDNPGKCKLGVINIPTPPEVRHIGPYKVSYLDICGPYTELPLPPIPNIEKITNQGLPSTNKPIPETLYFYMVENYPLREEKAQDPRTTPDCDNDSRWGGFVSSICNPKPNSEDSKGTVYYEWKLWLVKDPYGNNCCELFSNDTNGSNSFAFWYYTKPSKFILTCRVKYKWYDYDLLKFGDTVSKKSEIVKTNYAWPSDKSGSYSMASASKRLDEIMNTSEFSFMKGTPRTIDGEIINYRSKILGDLSIDNKKNEYWAIQPIDMGDDNPPPPPSGTVLIDSVERCDDLGNYNNYKYLTQGDYWSGVPADTKEFTIKTGETYYWRMAKASQTHLIYDISKTNKYQKTYENDDDFNLVAYLLSTPTIDGKENKYYVNKNPKLQFDPTEVGSCWWQQKRDSEGNLLNPSIKIEAYLEYILPNGSKKTEPLTAKASGDEIALQIESTLWQKNKPLIATMPSTLSIPPTDPLVGTISVRLTRNYFYNAYVINNGVKMGKFAIGPLPFVFKAEAPVRFLDTKEPEIVYSETNPINLFGLTGRPLAISYSGETRTNPSKVFFTISDNNTMEAGNNNGLSSLGDHIENYIYNYGTAAALQYVKGSSKMEQLYNQAIDRLKNKGELNNINIKARIAQAKAEKKKTSHLNYRRLFSKQARDIRFVFDSSAITKDGRVVISKANNLAKFDKNKNIYYSDVNNDMFEDDKSGYVYNPGVKALTGGTSYLKLENSDLDAYGDNAKMKFSMPLDKINLYHGSNVVPMGYANNTPGYAPYQFYVRATDCSGNYTSIKGVKDYLPLNMALHVRDDIPPIPYGTLTDSKLAAKGDNRAYRTFPEQVGSYGIVNEFENDNNKLERGIDSSSLYPTYIGEKWDLNFLRQSVWNSDNADGYIVGSKNTFKTLKSLYPNVTDIRNAYIGWGNGKLKDDVIKSQIAKNITPGYVEENVECTFRVFTTDNAGNSDATLAFHYNNDFQDSNGGWANYGFPYYTIKTNSNNPGTFTASITYDLTNSEAVSVFVGPTTSYPLVIPIILTAQDNAKDWDYYTGYANKPSDPSNKYSIWGELKKGSSRPNSRRLNTSLIVVGSNTDIRTLDKTLKNEK